MVFYDGLKEHIGDYHGYIKHLVVSARDELKADSNVKPSTEYSAQDILFIARQYLPSWAYPECVWKEDPVTRRRHISKALRSGPLSVRPRATAVHYAAIDWAESARYTLGSNYIVDIIDDLDSLLKTAKDFVTTVEESVDFETPLSLANRHEVLDNEVNKFLMKHKYAYKYMLHCINREFDALALLSGDLRVALESIRADAIRNSKMVRDDLFASHIEPGLLHLVHLVRDELKNLAEVFYALPKEDSKTSMALRNHTSNLLRTEIESLHTVKTPVAYYRSHINRVWGNALDELGQGPTSATYWVDMAVEVKEAAVNLCKKMVKMVQVKRPFCSCQCKRQFTM